MKKYLVALLASLGVVLTSRAAMPVFGAFSPCLLLYPTIILIALSLDVGPAIVATLVGCAAAEYFVVAPVGNIAFGLTCLWRGLAIVSMSLLVAYYGRRSRLARNLAVERSELHSLNRTLRAISKSNQAMRDARSETEYLAQACRIVLEDCGHAMAWVSYADDDPGKSIHPVASAGMNRSVLDSLDLSWADNEHGQSPVGTAIRTGEVVVSRDLQNDPAYFPWANIIARYDFAASIALPLITDGKAFGALAIYSRSIDPFSSEEIRLLTELASDLACGITTIRIRIERARAEKALRESEQRVRTKLDAILSPEGDLETLDLADILDVEELQTLMDHFYEIHPMTLAIVDLKGRVLVKAGWQDICMRFHRVHPETARNCLESDTLLSAGAGAGKFMLYKCRNNMWDISTPLFVGQHRVGNLFSGQFFLEGEEIDRELFRQQAHRYDFDEQEYLAALDRVPRLRREEVNSSMAFLASLAQMLSQLNYSKLKLARLLAERDRMEVQRSAMLEAERTARLETERLSRMKDEFLATLSHELRSPLVTINGWTQIMKASRPSDPEQVHAVEVIERNAEQLSELIEDLLDMERINSGKLRMEVREVDLPTLIQEVIESHAPAAAGRDLHVRVHYAAKTTHLRADPNRLRQIIANLLSNSLKFTPDGGRISIRVSEDASRLRIFVRDTGSGIATEFLPDIFGKFLQADGGTTRKVGGLGLGLAIARSMVELHGGTIEAHSKGLGRGSLFVVSLPLAADAAQADVEADEPAASSQPEDSPRPQVAQAGPRILLVDDDPDVLEIIARQLGEIGATVLRARSVDEGLRILQQERPDLLVSDISMPGEDGYDLLRKVRKQESGIEDIPCLALSALSRQEDRQRALEAGFDMYLSKTSLPGVLAKAVRKLLGRRGREKRPAAATAKGEPASEE